MLSSNITVDTTVEEVLTALGLSEIPDGCELKMSDEIEIEARVDDSDINITEVIDCDGLAEHIDKTAVMDLAVAIARGDLASASDLVESIFGAELTIREWMQQGRCSCRAHAA